MTVVFVQAMQNLLQATASVFLKSKLQFTHEPKTSFSILGFTKYFLTT